MWAEGPCSWIDRRSHALIWAGDRSDEVGKRLSGMSYHDIAAQGGAWTNGSVRPPRQPSMTYVDWDQASLHRRVLVRRTLRPIWIRPRNTG